MTIGRKIGTTSLSYCYIDVNGVYSGIKAEAYDQDTNGVPSSTNTLVTHLNKGETVHLSCDHVADMRSISSFSGVLIQSDTAP